MSLASNKRKLAAACIGAALILVLGAGVAMARNKTVYVVVKSAKLRAGGDVGQSEAVAYVVYGTELTVLDENENYYKVSVRDEANKKDVVGWISKKSVSDKRPKAEVQGRNLSGLSKLTGSQAGEAAASRGINEGMKYAKNKNLDKQFEWLKEMETHAPSPDALDKFMKEGGLGPYAGE